MKAKDLMIPVSDCVRVAEDHTIYDAVVLLEACRRQFQRSDYRPRVVLVHDKDFRIIGSLRHVDMLRAIASNGASGGASDPLSAPFGMPFAAESPESQLAAWSKVLTQLSDAAHRVRVRDVMYRYNEAEFIDEEAPLDEALTGLLSGPYLNLIVTSGRTSVGMLRLSDLFSNVCKAIKRSGME